MLFYELLRETSLCAFEAKQLPRSKYFFEFLEISHLDLSLRPFLLEDRPGCILDFEIGGIVIFDGSLLYIAGFGVYTFHFVFHGIV